MAYLERSLLQATEIEDSSLRQSVLHVILNCNVSAYGRVLLQVPRIPTCLLMTHDDVIW